MSTGALPDAALRRYACVPRTTEATQMARHTIAVFTKNRLNPAYHAARLGADRVAARMGAATVHYVPQQPDNVGEQRALIDAALAARPAAFVFVPVHGTHISRRYGQGSRSQCDPGRG